MPTRVIFGRQPGEVTLEPVIPPPVGAGQLRVCSTWTAALGSAWRLAAAGLLWVLVLSAQAATAIMPLGDSITAGVGSTSGAGYREMLQHLLTWHGEAYSFVGAQQGGSPYVTDPDHEGHPGWVIRGPRNGFGALTDITAARVGTYGPDVILLMAGTNPRDDGLNTVADRTADMAALLEVIFGQKPTARVFLAGIVPSPVLAGTFDVNAYAAAMANLAASATAAGRDVRYVDGMNTVSGAFPDNIHPGDEVYEQMAAVWFTAMTGVPAHVPARPTSVEVSVVSVERVDIT